MLIRTRNITVGSLVGIVVMAGVAVAGWQAVKPAAGVNPVMTRVAIQVLNDSVSLVTADESTRVVGIIAAPSPAPRVTSGPVAVPSVSPHVAASPCPANIDVSNSGPDSDVEVHCTTSSEGGSSGSTDISISNSVHQSSSGGQVSNRSSSSTSVHVSQD